MNETTQSIDVFSIVTNRIIEQLEHSVIPWQKPWTEAGHPQNLLTRRPYTGINTWMLASLGYAQNYFLTWKQLKAVGGSVLKGERGHVIVFWKKLPQLQREGPLSSQQPALILRYYKVFNIAQCDHLPEVLTIPYPPHTISQISACDEIVEQMPKCPTIKHGKQKAYYDPTTDHINMPKQGSFSSVESYYGTLFHELIHSTGHQSRLNRKEVVEHNTYGSDMYSIEELTAEIGACSLTSVAGIVNTEFDNSVAYIKGWIDMLKCDKRLIVYASGQARKATDYILQVSAYRSIGAQTEQKLETQ